MSALHFMRFVKSETIKGIKAKKKPIKRIWRK